MKNLSLLLQLKDEKGVYKKESNNIAVQTAPANYKPSHPFEIIDKYKPLSGPEIKLYRTLK